MAKRRGTSLFEMLAQPKLEDDRPGSPSRPSGRRGLWSRVTDRFGRNLGGDPIQDGFSPDDPLLSRRTSDISALRSTEPPPSEVGIPGRVLPELPEVESSMRVGDEIYGEVDFGSEDGGGFWAGLNRSVQIRLVTLLVYGVGVVLSVLIAYKTGVSSQPEWQERQGDRQNTQVWQEPEWFPEIDPQPVLKPTVRDIQDKSEVGKTPAGAAKAMPPDPHHVICCISDNPGKAELVMKALDLHNLGAPAGIWNKSGVFQIYVGPFAGFSAADKALRKVLSLRPLTNPPTRFDTAYVMPYKPKGT